MASVNELVDKWRGRARRMKQKRFMTGKGTKRACADDLEEVARTAWHPVSEPPTEVDGDVDNVVLIYDPEDGEVNKIAARKVQEIPDRYLWARIRDVVLLPPDP